MSLKDAIDVLVEEGKITREELEDAERRFMDKRIIQATVDNLHTQFCKLNHDVDCMWYDEDENKEELDPWTMKSHRNWMESFLQFLKSAQLSVEVLSEKSSCGPDYRFTPR